MESVQPYSVHWLSNVEIPLANKFYREHSFRGKAKRHQACAVVRDEHSAIIACAYVRDYDAFKLLAGVAVAPAHQGRGVARLLLQRLLEGCDDQLYTFPYDQLLPFYASLGFKRVDCAAQASALGDVYLRYRNQGRSISVMGFKQNPKSQPPAFNSIVPTDHIDC